MAAGTEGVAVESAQGTVIIRQFQIGSSYRLRLEVRINAYEQIPCLCEREPMRPL